MDLYICVCLLFIKNYIIECLNKINITELQPKYIVKMLQISLNFNNLRKLYF